MLLIYMPLKLSTGMIACQNSDQYSRLTIFIGTQNPNYTSEYLIDL